MSLWKEGWESGGRVWFLCGVLTHMVTSFQSHFTRWKVSKIPNHKGEKQRLFSKNSSGPRKPGLLLGVFIAHAENEDESTMLELGSRCAGWPASHSPSCQCWHEGQSLTMGREVSRSAPSLSCFYTRGWARTTLHVIAQQNEKEISNLKNWP